MLINVSSVWRIASPAILSPTSITNVNTFGVPNIRDRRNLFPVGFTNVSKFGASSVAIRSAVYDQTLTQTHFTNVSIFGEPAMSGGAIAPQALALTSIVNGSTFGAPTISTPPVVEDQTLVATAIVNVSVFGAPTIAVAASTVAMSYSNPMGSGARAITITKTPAWYWWGPIATDLVDGVTGSGPSSWNPDSTALWVEFDFGSPIAFDAFKFYTSTGNYTHGVWHWAWSDDDATWTDIGSDFTLFGWNTGTEFTEPNGNTAAHRYWRMSKVSGTTSGVPNIFEIEFRTASAVVSEQALALTSIVNGSTFGAPTISTPPVVEDQTLVATAIVNASAFGAPTIAAAAPGGAMSYSNPMGSGARAITASANSEATNSGGGLSPYLFDGNNSAGSLWFMNWSGAAWMHFDFGSPIAFDAFRLYGDITTSHGIWQWAWSDDDVSWTDVGSPFTLTDSSAGFEMTEPNGNTAAHRYWRMTKTSGSLSNVSYIWEIEFRTASAVVSEQALALTTVVNESTFGAPTVAVATSTGVDYLYDATTVTTDIAPQDFRNNFNTRQRYESAGLVDIPGATKVRVRFDTWSYTSGTLTEAFIGFASVSGDPYDFDGNQVRLTFDGGSTSKGPLSPGPIYSDEIDFPQYDHTKNLIVSSHWVGTCLFLAKQSATPNATSYNKSGASEAGITDVTGYASGYPVEAVSLVQVRAAGSPPPTMSYFNPQGRGYRVLNFPFVTGVGTTVTNCLGLVDGSHQSASFWFGSGAGDASITLDFGTATAFDAFKLSSGGDVASHGTWQWAWSDNNSVWTDIGSTFNLPSSADGVEVTEPAGNTSAHRYWQMRKVVGSTVDPWLYELEFRTAPGI